MGSYDTGESYTPPTRSRSYSGDVTPERTRSNATGSNDTQPSTTPMSTFYESAPLLISLGGGLTPSRIVKKIPEEYVSKTLYDVVK